jgi:hypothetical protein
MDLQDTLLIRLAQAEDAVSRLDERVARCAFRGGWIARQDFLEAVAWGWNAGRVTALEDLLLHDLSMEVRMPDDSLRATHGLVRARRKAMAGGEELLSAAGAAWLLDGRRQPPAAGAGIASLSQPHVTAPGPLLAALTSDLGALEAGVTEGFDAAVTEWLELLRPREPDVPRLLQAAVALEGWRIIQPAPRQTYLGPLLVGQWLRSTKRVRSHVLGLETGIRLRRRHEAQPLERPIERRILWWLGAIAAGAAAAAEVLNQLELARQVALGRVGARRAHSHVNDLIQLLLERPLVTAPMVAQKLKVTPQTARRLLGDLGGCVTETSGRARYRAWRL